MISRVEFRDEDNEEIQKHTHDRQITKILVEREPVLDQCQQMVYSILRKTIKPLIQSQVMRAWCHSQEIVVIPNEWFRIEDIVPTDDALSDFESFGSPQLYFNNNVETITRFSLVMASKRSQEGSAASENSRKFQKFFQQVNFLQKEMVDQYRNTARCCSLLFP